MQTPTCLIAPIQWLAQATPAPAPGSAPASAGMPESTTEVVARPWWQVLLDNGLALSILFIFLAAIISLMLNQRRKDKCLKLMHGYHATFLSQAGATIWGDVIVFSKGMELIFDAAYRTRRGIYKTSALIHEAQQDQLLALCRPLHALTKHEQKLRVKQIKRSFKPNIFRRTARAIRNLLSTLKDAFNSALSLLIGQLMKTKVTNPNLAGESKRVNDIGSTILGAAGNAYEQILERRIGKPVVLQIQCKHDGQTVPVDVPGYLVDYNAKHIAVFNVDHEPVETLSLTVTESMQGPGYKIDWVGGEQGRLKITCTGADLLVVRNIQTQTRLVELEVALLCGTSCELPTDGSASVTLQMERTRRVDLVAPRTIATVYHGGEIHRPTDRSHGNTGAAPEHAVEEASDDPSAPQDGQAQSAPPHEDPTAVAEQNSAK